MNRPDNHEAKMARADLFKLAQYSFKLFKMIQDHQELDGWVQAKITKAADYIASVYHYMEYEMKVNEYGDAIENADMYSESIRRAFQQKLVEAKEMAMKAKSKANTAEKDLDEGWDDMVKAVKDRDQGTGKFDKKEVKPGVTQYTRKSNTFSDEHSGGKGAHLKGSKADKKVKEGMAPMDLDGSTAPPPKGPDGQYPIITSGPNKGKRWSPQTPGPTNPALDTTRAKRPPVKEASKPDFLDMDKDGNKKEPMKKAIADKKVKETAVSGAPQKSGIPSTATTTVPGMKATQQDLKKANASAALGESKCNHTPKGEKCPVHGLKECGGMYEESKPSAGMSKKEKSAVVKKAKAGGDIGKPGKGFAKVEKAAKKIGAKDPKAVAAAAMWKTQAKK